MAINRDGEFEGDNLEKPLTIQKKNMPRRYILGNKANLNLIQSINKPIKSSKTKLSVKNCRIV